MKVFNICQCLFLHGLSPLVVCLSCPVSSFCLLLTFCAQSVSFNSFFHVKILMLCHCSMINQIKTVFGWTFTVYIPPYTIKYWMSQNYYAIIGRSIKIFSCYRLSVAYTHTKLLLRKTNSYTFYSFLIGILAYLTNRICGLRWMSHELLILSAVYGLDQPSLICGVQ